LSSSSDEKEDLRQLPKVGVQNTLPLSVNILYVYKVPTLEVLHLSTSTDNQSTDFRDRYLPKTELVS